MRGVSRDEQWPQCLPNASFVMRDLNGDGGGAMPSPAGEAAWPLLLALGTALAYASTR